MISAEQEHILVHRVALIFTRVEGVFLIYLVLKEILYRINCRVTRATRTIRIFDKIICVFIAIIIVNTAEIKITARECYLGQEVEINALRIGTDALKCGVKGYCRAACEEVDRLISCGSFVTVVYANKTRRKNRCTCLVILCGVKGNACAASARCVCNLTVLLCSRTSTVLNTNIRKRIIRVIGQLISQVSIYLFTRKEFFIFVIGRKVYVEGYIVCSLQKTDTVSIAFARLKNYVLNIVGSITLDSDVFILLKEHVDTVDGIALVPLVYVVCANLTESRHGGISRGGLAVSVNYLQILCLDGLGIVTGTVVGYVHNDPLRRIG